MNKGNADCGRVARCAEQSCGFCGKVFGVVLQIATNFEYWAAIRLWVIYVLVLCCVAVESAVRQGSGVVIGRHNQSLVELQAQVGRLHKSWADKRLFCPFQ